MNRVRRGEVKVTRDLVKLRWELPMCASLNHVVGSIYAFWNVYRVSIVLRSIALTNTGRQMLCHVRLGGGRSLARQERMLRSQPSSPDPIILSVAAVPEPPARHPQPGTGLSSDRPHLQGMGQCTETLLYSLFPAVMHLAANTPVQLGSIRAPRSGIGLAVIGFDSDAS